MSHCCSRVTTLLYYAAYDTMQLMSIANNSYCVYIVNEERDSSQADDLTRDNRETSDNKSLSTTV